MLGCTTDCRHIETSAIFLENPLSAKQKQFSTDSTRWKCQTFQRDDEFKRAMPYVVCLAVICRVLMEICYILGDNIVKMIDLLVVASFKGF